MALEETNVKIAKKKKKKKSFQIRQDKATPYEAKEGVVLRC